LLGKDLKVEMHPLVLVLLAAVAALEVLVKMHFPEILQATVEQVFVLLLLGDLFFTLVVAQDQQIGH
jgi:hypothetical protein